jgi:tetratricopeptide (TPR) repeat protein
VSRICLSLLAAGCLFGQGSEYEQGVALFQRGDAAAAVPHLLRAAEAQPKNAQRWKALGVAYASQKRYAEAAPAFRTACRLDVKLEEACYFWGRALYGLDRFAESLEALARADGRSWKVRLAMGQAADGAADSARAEREFREAIALSNGRDAGPGAAYGLFLVRQGRAAEAIPVLEAAVKLDPKSGDAETTLGRALFETGRTGDALPHLERAVLLAPMSAQAHLLLAKALVRAGRTDQAQEHFEAAAKYGTEK